MRKTLVDSFVNMALVLFLTVFALSGCSSPHSGGEEGTFTIDLSGGNSRAVNYPPSSPEDIAKLRFVVKFTPYGANSALAERTFTAEGTDKIQGTIASGTYTVTMQILLRADGSLFAEGEAANNPVTINPGPNPTIEITVHKSLSLTIDGDPWVNATLTANFSLPAGHEVPQSYQWKRGIATVGTDASYVVVPEDVGQPISVEVSFSNRSVTSAPVVIEGKIGIYTLAQLTGISSNMAGNYILVENNLQVIAPIGDNFLGTFDGNGNTIRLNITTPLTGAVGLFRSIGSTAMVRNLKLDGTINFTATSSVYIGAVAGENYGTIQDVSSTVEIESNTSTVDAYAGGIIGANEGTISNSSYTGPAISVEATRYIGAGGIVGENKGTIDTCYSTGSITASGGQERSAGGIVGSDFQGIIIKNNYSTGDVSAPGGRAGGIVGSTYKGNIMNNYSTGDISADTGSGSAGGIAGSIQEGEIKHCYSTGDISGGQAGGIAGYSNGGSISFCYAIGAISGGATASGGIVGDKGTTDGVSNSVALNNSVTGSASGRIWGRFGNGSGNNNYANATMGGGTWTDGPNDKDGLAVNRGVMVIGWWRAGQSDLDPPGPGPGWNSVIAASADAANEDTPWWWDGNPSHNRPRLWFEEL